MTHLDQFVSLALEGVGTYPRCTHEQARVYACEDVVESELGSRLMASSEIDKWLIEVCAREDIDAPNLVIARASSKSLASADTETHTICIRGKNTTVATVLHEIAHVIVGVDSHGVLFRDELVRLCRFHISVDYAAMLHNIYLGIGLPMSPWPASASRR